MPYKTKKPEKLLETMKDLRLTLLSTHPSMITEPIEVLCFCGKVYKTTAGEILSLHRKSCGCRFRENRIATKHGDGRRGLVIPEHRAWRNMKGRCTPGGDYWNRGIRVCKRWFNSYKNFLEDVGRRPSARHSLDRINNDGNYEPGNTRWAVRSIQNRNSRRNHLVTWKGRTQCITDWNHELGYRIEGRLKAGWPLSIVMTHRPHPVKRTRWWKLEASKGEVTWQIPTKK